MNESSLYSVLVTGVFIRATSDVIDYEVASSYAVGTNTKELLGIQLYLRSTCRNRLDSIVPKLASNRYLRIIVGY